MTKNRQRTILFALLALSLVFAGCKGESPTAPAPATPGAPGGGITPPTSGLSITLTSSNPSPLVDSSSLITATVTQNGSPVPNGTAVEFQTTLGLFEESETVATIRTTTNGVATVTVTSSSPGTATVGAFIGSASRTIDVVFRAQPEAPPVPPSTAPTITAISPAIGSPQGGDTLTITGTNFRAPRVFFDLGGGRRVEGFVLSVTPTQIRVRTPHIDIGAAQIQAATIVVLNDAGTPAETSVTAGTTFTFQNTVLTPVVIAVSPGSGPINGGTRITIFGEGFQAPVQVGFGAGGVFSEAQVISVSFNQIIAITPAARDTAPNGSGTVVGPLDVRVINIGSNTMVTFANAFRYTPKMQITAFRPGVGPALGGTDITIDGIGFDDPVAVSVGGFPAQPLRVSGTQLLVRTSPLAAACAGATGPIVVTNVDNGDTATSVGAFTYIGIKPIITAVVPAGGVAPGANITVSVLNPGIGQLGSANIRFTIAGRTLIPNPSVITNGTGTQDFTIAIPTTGFVFPTEACTTGGGLAGTRFGPIDTTVVFTNTTTACIDTLENGVRVNPPSPNPCLTPPRPSVTNPAGGTCATPGPASLTGVGFPTSTQTPITISNAADAQPLNITAVSISGAGADQFSIAPTSASGITAGGSQNFVLTFAPDSAGNKTATVTFTTNSTTTPTVTVCVNANAVP